MKTLIRMFSVVMIAAAVAGPLAFGPTPAFAAEAARVLVNRDKDGLAIQGYDPVAYFTDSKPVKGSSMYRAKFGGATYQFASAEHKQMFEASPEKYAPQFGGYCGYAASINKVSPIDPNYWEILDGRLVLQHNKKAWGEWHKDVSGNLALADKNWPGLVARNGKAEKVLVNTDSKGVAIQGYDPVAYFTDGKPVMGQASIMAVYGGAIYHFASVEHKNAFEQDPAKYEPQFGGYCAYAASINKVSTIDPTIFQIEDGRLLLQHTKKAYDLFNKDAKASLAKADTNWPGLVRKQGK